MTINEKATTYTFGTAGSDTINAQYLLGDLINALAGNDTITGLDGSDTLLGGEGRDTIYGLGGHDVLDGGSGNDGLFGGAGNDILRPDNGRVGNDYMDGGEGLDTVDYGAFGGTRGVRVDLRISSAQDTRGAGFDTIRNVENVVGTNFDDVIIGSDGDNFIMAGAGRDNLSGGNGSDILWAGFGDLDGDTLSGGNGNDSLVGGSGKDTLSGGAGDDFVTGSLGADILSGGTGRDRFNFQSVRDSDVVAVDRILDFNGADDIIILQPLEFSANVAFIGSNAFAPSGIGQIRVTSNAGIQLVEVDVNGDGSGDMNIQVVGTALGADDFAFSIFGT